MPEDVVQGRRGGGGGSKCPNDGKIREQLRRRRERSTKMRGIQRFDRKAMLTGLQRKSRGEGRHGVSHGGGRIGVKVGGGYV